MGGGGHIVFSADPVGVGIRRSHLSALYLLIEWTDFGTNISLGGGKNAD